MAARRFAPPGWSWFALLPALALLCSLGLWQAQRGLAKQALIDRQADALAADAQPLDPAADAPVGAERRRVRVSGRYLPEAQMLLDNQSLAQRPGYHVWTPLRTQDDAVVIVDRGWVALAEGPMALEVPLDDGPRQVEGLWRPLPRPAIRLGEVPSGCADTGAGGAVVQYPTADALRCRLGERLAPGVLLLSAHAEDGFVREWSSGWVEVPPSRHYGYSAQWFAFAVTLVVLFYRLSLVPR